MFQIPDVSRTLNLTEQQLNQLGQADRRLRGVYDQGLRSIGNLNAQDRAARVQELAQTYNTDFLRSAQGILTPPQLNRYRQLDFQYRGLVGLTDPAVQRRLNLTDAQLRSLGTLRAQTDRELADITRSAGTNRDEAVRRYNDLRRQTLDRTNAILDANQRRLYRELSGEPFTFPPNFNQTTGR